MDEKFHISTDKEKLDKVFTSIEQSLCFGVYIWNQQIGFARVVTDYTVFAWVLDVFIIEKHRGNGLGKLLVSSIMNHQKLQGINRWGLNTFDAHSLYEKFGFKAIEKPEINMEITSKTK